MNMLGNPAPKQAFSRVKNKCTKIREYLGKLLRSLPGFKKFWGDSLTLDASTPVVAGGGVTNRW